jgi:hypothetical protein
MNLRSPLLTTTIAGLFACNGSNDVGTGSSTIVGSDTLTFEGEYRAVDGQGTWMRCNDGHDFPVKGPASDTLIAVYSAAVGRMGDATKVWLRGGWSEDSVVVALNVLHLAPAMRCPAIPQPGPSGSYKLALREVDGEERSVRFDLFPNGDAVQFSTLPGGIEREEWGSWGVNSDDQVQILWPQRGANFLFGQAGDSLTPIAPFPAGIHFAMVRIGPPDPAKGIMGEVHRLIDAQPARSTSAGFGITASLTQLLPGDTGLAVLADTLKARYGMTDELHERRWEDIATVQDLAELVRMLQR